VSRRRPEELTPERLPALVEALLFVAGGPVEETILAKSVGLPLEEVQAAIERLTAECAERGVRIQRSGSRVQFVTAPAISEYVERFLGIEQRTGLSTAALETLAIIAYRQPVTRGGIEAVRGVNSDNAVATLLQRELIEEVGRATGPGRPALFATTMRFFEHFGLAGPHELPPLEPETAATTA
jgi:segregation and condensation protein B